MKKSGYSLFGGVDSPSLKSLKAYNSDAWRQLSDILAPKIRYAINAKMGTSNHAETQELESKVFSWLLKKVKKGAFRDVRHLEARAIIKANSMAIDFIRSVDGRPNPKTNPDNDCENPNSFGKWFNSWFKKLKPKPEVADDSNPADEIIEQEMSDILKNLLEALNEDQRNILKLIYLEGMTQQEVADKLGMPRNTVGVYCSRGLGIIKGEISRHPQLLEDFKSRHGGIKLLPEIILLALLMK